MWFRATVPRRMQILGLSLDQRMESEYEWLRWCILCAREKCRLVGRRKEREGVNSMLNVVNKYVRLRSGSSARYLEGAIISENAQ